MKQKQCSLHVHKPDTRATGTRHRHQGVQPHRTTVWEHYHGGILPKRAQQCVREHSQEEEA